MRRRLFLAGISVLTCLLFLTPGVCFAMVEIETVSKERAKELGLEIRSNAAGPDLVRVELAFDAKALPGYSRVDFEIRDGGKLLSSCSLREETAEPGRVVVSFAADRTKLAQMTLRIMTGVGTRSMVGRDIHVNEFVDLDKLR